MEENIRSQSTLGGRRINFCGVNIDLIHKWVKTCEEHHDDFCLPVPTNALRKIRLIDVETREVVEYPEIGCEYIALSYIWGNVAQDRYRIGDTIQSLPKTLEDALSLTKQLGKRYTWIDSVCIDQTDEQEKADQINRMWSIYQGAWMTVIPLSGTSVNDGLPRFSRKEHHRQLTCRIDGRTLVGLMPTLSQQIWMSPWGRRAWTLQEGLLSARCLYISDHQIYYDCSSMQCCESLDESKSWAHSLTPASNTTEEGFVTWMLRQAGAGALRIPLDWPPRRLEHWGEKLNLYSYRKLTYTEDAISAFTGVLQRLESIYPEGFFWALPVEDFDWALTWASQMPPRRRDGFPSWSWAGWEGYLFFGQPTDVKKTRRIPTDLKIGAAQGGSIKEIFAGKGDDCTASGHGIGIVILNDPVHKAARQEPHEETFDLHKYPAAERDGYLFVTAVCFHFRPDFSNPRTQTYAMGQNEVFLFTIKDVRCFIRIFSTDKYIPGHWTGENWVIDPEKGEERTFLLLARDHYQGFILHKIMLLKMLDSSNLAERVTVFELLVPLDELDILEEFKPRKQMIILM